MFRTGLLSIIRSLNTVYTAIGICHASYVDSLLARSGCSIQLVNITSMKNTYCCVYSAETPDVLLYGLRGKANQPLLY